MTPLRRFVVRVPNAGVDDDRETRSPRVEISEETAEYLTEELVPDAVSLPEAIRTAMRRGIEEMERERCGRCDSCECEHG